MSYATQGDLEARFGAAELVQVADRDGDDVADAAFVADALAYADGLIDTHLAARYALPVAPVPELLLRLACDLARYRLHADAPTEVVKANHKLALELLRDLAAGRATLVGAEGTQPVSGGVAIAGGQALLGPEQIGDFLGTCR